MDNALLPVSLILNFTLLTAFAWAFVQMSKRNARLAEMEGRAESRVRDLERNLEESGASLEAARNQRKELEAELAELRESSKDAAETWQREREGLEAARAEEAAKLEPLQARVKEAELGVGWAERECARLRTEAQEARKRMESAESAASEQISRYEQLEAAHTEKTDSLKKSQARCAQLEGDLKAEQERLAEQVTEREQLESELAALQQQLADADRESSRLKTESHNLRDALGETKGELQTVRDQLAAQRKSAEDAAASGGEAAERCRALEERILDLEGRLSRKEAALVELEAAYRDASGETTYAAHRHMEWTLNHYDPQAITFKFTNEGAKAYLVGVETNYPELRYELETGHDLPRDKEARIKLAIRKAEQARMAELPEEIDLTVLYALHVFPIQFKIRPRAGQKIERIH